MSKAMQRGFTLIELVVVIVILGILAAFAVPRFINLQGQARVAAVSALAGSVRSASALAHAAWLAGGSSGDVAMEGATVAMTAAGYPTNAAIDDALASVAGFDVPVVAGTVTTFAFTGGVAPCAVTYDTSTTPPSIDSDTSGCD